MRFLSWIIENEDSKEKIVQRYFPSFTGNEEMKNKLRSNKELAEMTLCYTKYEKLLKDNGFENIEYLIEAMNNNKNQLEDAENIKNREPLISRLLQNPFCKKAELLGVP